MGSPFYPYLLPSAYNMDVGCDGWSFRSHLGPEETSRMEATLEKQRSRAMVPVDFITLP